MALTKNDEEPFYFVSGSKMYVPSLIHLKAKCADPQEPALLKPHSSEHEPAATKPQRQVTTRNNRRNANKIGNYAKSPCHHDLSSFDRASEKLQFFCIGSLKLEWTLVKECSILVIYMVRNLDGTIC